MLFSTTLLATAAVLEEEEEEEEEGAGLGVGPVPPVSLVSERVPPLTMSERVLGPSSLVVAAEVWLVEVVGGAEVGAVPFSVLEELGRGGK